MGESTPKRSLWDWPLPLAAVWLILPVAGVLIAATVEPIPPHDYWWHLAMGRLIAANGALPAHNTFLYTIPVELPFVDQPWLAQWAMFSAFDWGGYGATVWLRNFMLVPAFALLVSAAARRGGDPRAVGAIGLLSAVLAYPVLTVRTRAFAFLPFAATLWLTLDAERNGIRRRTWLCVPLVALWANVHGSFVLGPVIVAAIGGATFVEGALRGRTDWRQAGRWGALFGAMTAAGAVTPHGFATYGYVLQLAVLSDVGSSVSEWQPPDIAEPLGVVFALSVLLAAVSLGRRRSNVQIWEALLVALGVYLGAGAVRSMFWWAALLLVVVPRHISSLAGPQPQEDPSPAQGFVNATIIAGALALCLAVQPGVLLAHLASAAESGQARHDGDGAWILNHEHPTRLVATLAKEPARGRIFHDQVLGGMLEFWLTEAETPSQVAFVDQRMEFVPEHVWDQYFAISRAQQWQEGLDAWDVEVLLLSPESQWPLLAAAHASGRWELVDADHSHVLLRRRSLDGAEDPAEE